MKKISKKLKALVIKEAENIKVFASKREIKRLDFSTLNPTDRECCVYGQMTKNCFSDRAGDLIMECATMVLQPGPLLHGLSKAKISGPPLGHRRDSYAHVRYFSPIEVFIYKATPAENKKLIRFLKGETKTLKL